MSRRKYSCKDRTCSIAPHIGRDAFNRSNRSCQSGCSMAPYARGLRSAKASGNRKAELRPPRWCLSTRCPSPFLIASIDIGRPSRTLLIGAATRRLPLLMERCVRSVARMVKPCPRRARAPPAGCRLVRILHRHEGRRRRADRRDIRHPSWLLLQEGRAEGGIRARSPRRWSAFGLARARRDAREPVQRGKRLSFTAIWSNVFLSGARRLSSVSPRHHPRGDLGDRLRR